MSPSLGFRISGVGFQRPEVSHVSQGQSCCASLSRAVNGPRAGVGLGGGGVGGREKRVY